MFFLLCFKKKIYYFRLRSCIESLRLKLKDQANENKLLEDKNKHVYSRNARRNHQTITCGYNDREENKTFTVKERRTDRLRK